MREDWSGVHDETLLRAMVSLLLANRRMLSATPGLEGVADHGGERINKKIQAFARRVAGEYVGVVKDEMGKVSRKRKDDRKGKDKDAKEAGEMQTRKKRKL